MTRFSPAVVAGRLKGALAGVYRPSAGPAGIGGRVRAWFAQQTPREQFLLIAGAVTVAGAVFFLLVWSPLSAARDQTIDRIALLERITAQAGAINPASLSSASLASEPATAVVTSEANALGLSIKRLESEGVITRVTFDDIKFERLLLWLESLERKGNLRAVSVELDRRPEPGVVNARIGLER